MIDYYDTAKKASLEYKTHPFLKELKKIAENSTKILDNGCGEGSRLFTVAGSKRSWGVDINKEAILKANTQYPQHIFKLIKPNKLPFKNDYFDLVYSAFVLEHTKDPDKYIYESFRVLKPKGTFVIICPNFGAPNRRSPNTTENPIKKFLRGIVRDIRTDQKLAWTFVSPKKSYNQIDDDTSVEPYVAKIIHEVSNYGLVKFKTTLWELEPWSSNPRKFIFKLLGLLNIYPISNWGPQVGIICEKK